MQIIRVESGEDEKIFLRVAQELYHHDPKWIRPLDKDILDTFNPEKNKAFRFGKAARWVLLDESGKPAGRIAAFVNSKYKNKGDTGPAGGIGYFECINNQDGANLLFDNARHWLIKEGMETMDGPINFGERDRFWGLVTRGFMEPLYAMNYNPPYYAALFEEYGFKPFYHQICLGLDPKAPLAQKIYDKHRQLAADPNNRAEHLRKKNLEKYARDFTDVYNAAWAGHGGLKEMSFQQAMMMFKKMKPVMDERIIWFAYHRNEPVALFVNLPDLNQWFRYLNGKFGLWQKLKFLGLKRFRPNKKFVGIVFGVIPAWQGKGMDSFLIGESHKLFARADMPYTEYEMQWIGDFNPKMINVGKGLGDVSETRRLTTYRYLFDRTAPFCRHPLLN